MCEYINFFLKVKLEGIFNVGDENLSYYVLAKKIIKEHGNKKSKIIKINKGHKSKFILDVSKLQNQLKKYNA